MLDGLLTVGCAVRPALAQASPAHASRRVSERDQAQPAHERRVRVVLLSALDLFACASKASLTSFWSWTRRMHTSYSSDCGSLIALLISAIDRSGIHSSLCSVARVRCVPPPSTPALFERDLTLLAGGNAARAWTMVSRPRQCRRVVLVVDFAPDRVCSGRSRQGATAPRLQALVLVQARSYPPSRPLYPFSQACTLVYRARGGR